MSQLIGRRDAARFVWIAACGLEPCDAFLLFVRNSIFYRGALAREERFYLPGQNIFQSCSRCKLLLEVFDFRFIFPELLIRFSLLPAKPVKLLLQ